jgi:glycosyltransferase involved in cell wall biosynthesis
VIEISVIICTHNPRPQYLARVLAALRAQTLPIEQWELLIIDNVSQVPLTVANWDLSWHPRARIVREEELGIASARMRGMREMAADTLVFVDDDNVLDPGYLAEVLRIGREWPQLGVWGGSIVPEFEVQPPEYLKEFLGCLALREIKTPRWSNLMTCLDAEPWGAGMSVRINVAKEYMMQFRKGAIQIMGARGMSLLGGEDVEICYVACSLGLGMGLFPELKLTHLIPKERIDEDYLVRMAEGIHTTAFLLTYKWQGICPRSLFAGLGVVSMLRDILHYRGIHRRMYLARLRGIIAARRTIAAMDDSAPLRPIIAQIGQP